MKYSRFEDLPVWQHAMLLAEKVFLLTADPAFARQGDLRSQVQRASLSVSNNIAEGFERGTTSELISFIYIARGSAGEVRSMLHLMDRLPVFTHLKSQISDLRSLAESISRQLRAWADHLQNSEIKGQRYLTDQTRMDADAVRRRAEFERMLQDTIDRSRRPGGIAGNGPQAQSPPPPPAPNPPGE